MQVAAMPFRWADREVEILLITTRETRRWIVPKGWPHKGKSFPDSAACEALEEAGVTGQVFREALGSYRYDKRLAFGQIVALEVMVYPLRVETQRPDWREIGQREQLWASLARAEQLVEPALRPLLGRLADRLSMEAAA
jgi:8-oxo-dGTP pyrophosphatase MutT (NUDIX family)